MDTYGMVLSVKIAQLPRPVTPYKTSSSLSSAYQHKNVRSVHLYTQKVSL
jgi:hypothetical protein